MSLVTLPHWPMSSRKKVLATIWLYSAAVCALIGAIVYYMAGSILALLPVLIMFLGGVGVGTIAAYADKSLDE